jgi:hypothetical protein
MGRPAKSAAEHKLTRTYRPDRHAPRVVGSVPRDPGVEAAEWDRLAEARTRVTGAAGLAFVDRMASAYAEWSAAELELLVQAAALVTTIAECESRIARDGLLLKRRDGAVRHPVTITLGAARTELRHTLRALGLLR